MQGAVLRVGVVVAAVAAVAVVVTLVVGINGVGGGVCGIAVECHRLVFYGWRY